MKLVTIFLLAFFLNGSNPLWLTDFAKAKLEAKQSNKYMLLNFSGSDWCTPCIRMHKTIFESAAFETFAGKELVLVNADFPRLKKHQLIKDQQKENEALAEQYNPSGKFPYTLLLSNDGRVVSTWEGCPSVSAEKFVDAINAVIHGSK
jgi:thioredoxin-related protein